MRLGFVGGWGHIYLKYLLTRPGHEIEKPVAVASDGIDAEKTKEVAKNLGVPTVWFDSIEQMIEQYKPDIINMGAVYGHAGEVAAKALERGVSVVTDKPAAATWQQLDRLRDILAKNKNVQLITEFPFRSQVEMRSAHDAVKDGLIGDVVLASGQKSYRFGNRPKWYGSRKEYGGTLLWVAGHAIDGIEYVTGETLTKVTGRQGNLSHPELPEMEDHVVSLFGLSGGGSAVVHADILRPAPAPTHGDDRLRVIGTKGVLEVRDGLCKLITSGSAETDITNRSTITHVSEELLEAAQGKNTEIYSTVKSLRTAALLLHARDASDKETWIDLK